MPSVPRKKHGNIIILKPKYKQYVIDYSQSKVAPADAQYITLPLGYSTCSIANLYLPAHHSYEHEELGRRIIEEASNYLLRTPNSIRIMPGDWNTDITSNSTRPTMIRSILNSLDLHLTILSSPTHRMGNVIDYAMISQQIQHSVSVLPDNFIHLDHLPVILEFQIQNPTLTTTINRYKNINNESLRIFSNGVASSAHSSKDILEFHKLIIKEAGKAFTKVQHSLQPSHIFHSQEIRHLKTKMKILHRHLRFLEHPSKNWPQSFQPPLPIELNDLKQEIYNVRTKLR